VRALGGGEDLRHALVSVSVRPDAHRGVKRVGRGFAKQLLEAAVGLGRCTVPEDASIEVDVDVDVDGLGGRQQAGARGKIEGDLVRRLGQRSQSEAQAAPAGRR
jgi:hypothetical protein